VFWFFRGDYLTVHKDARLTKEQRDTISNWAKSHIKEDEY